MVDNDSKDLSGFEENFTTVTARPIFNQLGNEAANNFYPQPGLILSDTYCLERLLGKGGMGEVWLANHIILDELRAIKFLSSAQNAEDRQRFIYGEARNALRLQHPNIVRVFDVGQSPGFLYIAMELIEGNKLGFDLRQVFSKKKKFSFEEIDNYLQQIAAALYFAHENNLVHRDVKPANILVTSSNVLKLTDFGLVKDLNTSLELTSGSYGFGTPIYMAPEQANGQATPASDQYALGIMIYEWLVGKPPFSGNLLQLTSQHAHAAPRPLTEIVPTISTELNSVVLKALAKSPSARFASVLDLATAFHAALCQDFATLNNLINQSSFVDTANKGSTPTFSNQAEKSQLDSQVLQHPNNLPEQINNFIGREAEIAEIGELVQKSLSRLITLTGVGGTGKTRLALQVAQTLLPAFKDGVFFVSLENVTERATFINELMVALQIKNQANQSSLDMLKAWLKDKTILLILDNFEQLVTKGATLVAELLKAAPKLKIVVTSREELHLSSEIEYEVAPLALPDKQALAEPMLDNLLNYPAISLFADRAIAAKTDFRLTEANIAKVVEICQKLDGLPLALELAAARIKIFSPQKILERLNLKLLAGGNRDLPTRQQTLRNTIDWSYDLLEPEEQILFARLSIFVGGCTILSAEQIANAENDLSLEPMDGIESLCQKSLLRQWEGIDGERHYGMLQIVREYGLEKLNAQGELEKLNQKFVSYYADLTKELEPKLVMGKEQSQSLCMIDSEYENIREVLFQSLEAKIVEPQAGITIVGALEYYWEQRGYLNEGLHYVEQALTFSEIMSKKAQARTLEVASRLSWSIGNFAVSGDYAEKALTINREIGDKQGTANCLNVLGNLVIWQQDFASALERYQECLSLYREIGDKSGIAHCLINLGTLSNTHGDLLGSIPYYEEAVPLCREIGEKRGLCKALINLGVTFYKQGDFGQTLQYYREALAVCREIGDKQLLANCLINLGELTTLQGNLADATIYLEEAIHLCRESGNKRAIAYCLNYLGSLATSRGELTKANSYLHEALQSFQEAGNKGAIIETQCYLGDLAMSQEDLVTAAKFYTESLTLSKEIGDTVISAIAVNGLGCLALYQRDYAAAANFFMEGLALSQEGSFYIQEATALNGLAVIALEQQNLDEVVPQLKRSLAISQKIENKKLIAESLCSLIAIKLQDKNQSEPQDAVQVATILGTITALASFENDLLVRKPWLRYYAACLEQFQHQLGKAEFQAAFEQGKDQKIAASVDLALSLERTIHNQ